MNIKNGLEIRSIAGEKMVVVQGKVGTDKTKVITFNDTAEWLWNKLYGKDFTVNDVTDLLVDKFDVSRETAEADAKQWVDSLAAKEAIV